MNILAFDTSLDKTYISLLKGVSEIAEGCCENGAFGETFSKIIPSDEENYHSAYLISGIKKITDENNIKLRDIDLFAVNNGPGSFTGLRVGAVVAKTLAKELNTKVIGVNSLDILRKVYQNLGPDVILDARREMFYFKNSENGGNIELVPYNEIEKYISKDTVICDTSSFQHIQNLKILKGRRIINFEEDGVNLSLALAELAKEQYAANTNRDEIFVWHNLKPMYIQAPPIHKHA